MLEALRKAGRTDLIGYTPGCLIRPKPGPAPWELEREEKRRAQAAGGREGTAKRKQKGGRPIKSRDAGASGRPGKKFKPSTRPPRKGGHRR